MLSDNTFFHNNSSLFPMKSSQSDDFIQRMMAAKQPLTPTPTLIVPGLPTKTFVGVDLITFTSTLNFHGITDLPEGWHFFYTGASESYSLRRGSWFYVGNIAAVEQGNHELIPTTTTIITRSLSYEDLQSEIRVWKWNRDAEALIPLKQEVDSDRQEAMRYKANLGSLWQSGKLFRYRSRVPSTFLAERKRRRQRSEDLDDMAEEEVAGRSDWINLTKWLSPRLLSRVLGDPNVDVDGQSSWTLTTASTAADDADQIPGLTREQFTSGPTDEEEKELQFLSIDLKQTWPKGAIGRARTEAAQDRSWALGNLIEQSSASASDDHVGEAQILGELQFTFLMVLTTMNYSCLQQWMRLLKLILTCQAAIKSRETFFQNFLELLLLQLQHSDDVEGGLFELIDNDSNGSFLKELLIGFRRSTLELIWEGAESGVKSRMKELETFVKREFDWELRPEAIVRRGMLSLEDGEQVEMEINGADKDDETGEYAPVVVDLVESSTVSDDIDDTMSDIHEL